SRHRRRGGPPIWIWFLMAGLGLAVVVGGILFSIKQFSSSTVATAPTAQQPAATPTADAAAADATAANSVAARPVPAEIQKLIERAIVRIELQADADQEAAAEKVTGSGFLIHKSGLVATTYHVICQAAKADVQFANGERLPVAGYVALRPDCDLAILK